MTPETLVLDRAFRGVGRVKRATGTLNPAVRRKMSKMLTDLHGEGRLDLLRAVRDGEITLLELHDAYQRKTLAQLPTAQTAKPLAKTMAKWIAGLRTDGPSPDCSAKHKESLETSRRYFERQSKKATINDLPKVLEKLRVMMGDRPRSFNLARAAGLAFVRSTLKRSHPLYLAVAAVDLRPITAQRPHVPLTVKQMWGFFPDPIYDPVDAIAWSMATTGMGQGELWGDFHNLDDRVHIGGTKRAGRVRDVPLVVRPTIPQMHRRTFEDAVRERTRAFTVYDLRRTYANWLEAAGIPRTRRRLYLGHGAGDVTDLYERHEVAAFLKADAEKLTEFLGLSPTKAHTMTLHRSEAV